MISSFLSLISQNRQLKSEFIYIVPHFYLTHLCGRYLLYLLFTSTKNSILQQIQLGETCSYLICEEYTFTLHKASFSVPGGTFFETERERNVLFNDALNTFYLRLYGVRHMVEDHSDSEKGNPLLPHRLLLSISSKGYFICTDRITHTTAFVTPVVEHWLEREIVQWVHPMKDRSDDPPHHERTLFFETFHSLKPQGCTPPIKIS